MGDGYRKATDILLSLETKIDQLLIMDRNKDLIFKILSNKLNDLISSISDLSNRFSDSNNLPTTSAPQNVQQPVVIPDKLLTEVAPNGFRRTSRPETFDKNPAATISPSFQEPNITMPVQFPEYTPPSQQTLPQKPQQPKQLKKTKNEDFAKDLPVKVQEQQKIVNSDSKIPVSQRVVDKNGSALFLAEVQIFNDAGNLEHKTRTNGIGKWQASLSPGYYKVKINKQESVSKEKLDITQEVTITGATNTQDLPVLIAK